MGCDELGMAQYECDCGFESTNLGVALDHSQKPGHWAKRQYNQGGENA